MDTLGMRLKTHLAEKGIKQIDIAKRIGITSASMSQFCNDIASPGPRTVKAICDALDINEEWLRTGEGEMKRETPRTIVDELAKAYNLTPAVTRLLDAIAQAFVELPEDVAQQIVDRLRAALAEEDEAARDASAVRSAIDAEGPEETGPGITEKSQAE